MCADYPCNITDFTNEWENSGQFDKVAQAGLKWDQNRL